MDSDLWKSNFGGDNVTHLYTTNKEVAQRNVHCLKNVGKPIVKINAKNTGKGSSSSSNIAGGLDCMIHLCANAQIILTNNIWQSAGLCNGTTGIVKEIIFYEDSLPQIYVLVSLLILATDVLVHHFLMMKLKEDGFLFSLKHLDGKHYKVILE